MIEQVALTSGKGPMRDHPFVVGVLTGAIQAGTSVLYAALGEVVSERAGIINLGVEGTMLMGASTGFIVTSQTGESVARDCWQRPSQARSSIWYWAIWS